MSIPLSPDEFNIEQDSIIYIAHLNNLQIDVKKIIRKKLVKRLLASSSVNHMPATRIRWVRLPFIGSASYRMAHYLRKYNHRVPFYSLMTLSHLSSLKDVTPLLERCGVYELFCSCGTSYIGQTGWSFRERFAEHLNNSGEKSAFAIDSGHNINDSSLSILHPATKRRLLNRLEEIETYRAIQRPNHLLTNDMSNVLVLPFTAFIFGNT